jgi:hypothetical protein
MPSAEGLRSMVRMLEAPVTSALPWTQDLPDSRPFGPGWWLPTMALLYLLSLTVLKLLFAGVPWVQAPLKYFMLLNNTLMAVYSGWTTLAVGATVWANAATDLDSSWQIFCDPGRALMKDLDLQMYIFYISKFWEWLDTYALVLKGKDVWPPSSNQFFLHIFHHSTTGAIAWLAWQQELSVAWIGPLTNGFVHTLMYAYYALVTVFPGVRKFGLYITPIQIFQFIICLTTVAPEAVDALVLGGAAGCGMTKRCAVWMAITYGAFLYMFWQLYNDKKRLARKQAAQSKAA